MGQKQKTEKKRERKKELRIANASVLKVHYSNRDSVSKYIRLENAFQDTRRKPKIIL